MAVTTTAFVAQLAAAAKISKRLAKDILDLSLEMIIDSVKKGEEVRFQGFGTFRSSKRAARKGVNPQNPKQTIDIPAMKVVSFRAGSDFKKAVR
jgi:DNA-binding protein HU-beta